MHAGRRVGEGRAQRERGATVEIASLYDTIAEPIDPAWAPALAGADYLTFTSSSTVRFYFASAEAGPDTRIVSIGPVTSEALRERGLTPHVEAARHDVDGLLEAIVSDRRSRGRTR